jgi:2-methylcitrate dehydratase PrpD
VAAATSKLLHLDENWTRTAFRLAADEACGFRQYQLDGNIANSAFHGSKAAENGMIAALLAKEGFVDPGETQFLPDHAISLRKNYSRMAEPQQFNPESCLKTMNYISNG